MPLTDFYSATPGELAALLKAMDEPAYRAVQIFSWIHKRGAKSFGAMTDLPRSLRDRLDKYGFFPPVFTVAEVRSKAGDTVKYLFELENKAIMIEAVHMRNADGETVCVSTQAGCRMGCVFCASGANGLLRHLTAGEMCAQVYAARAGKGSERSEGTDTGAEDAPPTQASRLRVVMMGCGEPLDNLSASMRFIELISDPKGLGLGRRHITLSTCGLVPGIYKLAERRWPVTLAVSLHAPDDDTRERLMPVARRYRIEEVLRAAAHYAWITGRRVTYEYALIAGINDTEAHANALARLLAGTGSHVNLIPANAVHAAYKSSRRTDLFARTLTVRGVNATVRRSLGGDIDAACGQLRARYGGEHPGGLYVPPPNAVR